MTVAGPQAVSVPALWKSIVLTTRQWSCPIQSIIFRLSDRWPIPDVFVHDLLDAHALTLKHVAMLDCDISVEGIRAITTRCPQLNRLAIYVPKRELVCPSVWRVFCG